MSDLWTEASRDHDAELHDRRLAVARVRASAVWPFLAAAKSKGEYAARRTLAEDSLRRAVADVVGDGPEFGPLYDDVVTSFDTDFDTLSTARDAEAVTAALKTANDLANGKPVVDDPSTGGAPRSPRTEGPFKVQVAGNGENVWSENALRHQSEEEAKAYASDLLSRWMGADMARVVPSETPNREPVDPNDPRITHNYRTGSVQRTADNEAPYKIVESGGKFYVENAKGERKESEGYATREEAREHQKALYANVPGASEKAEREHKESARKTAVHLTNVRKTADPLVFEGTDPSGKDVKFKVTEDEAQQLGSVMTGDLAQNMSGVEVDEGDIVSGDEGARRLPPSDEDRAMMQPKSQGAPVMGSLQVTGELRPIHQIAADIHREWSKQGGVHPWAKPYLSAMHSLSSTSDKFGEDDGDGIVAYFLSNARTFKGEAAKALKAELKGHLQEARSRRGSKTAMEGDLSGMAGPSDEAQFGIDGGTVDPAPEVVPPDPLDDVTYESLTEQVAASLRALGADEGVVPPFGEGAAAPHEGSRINTLRQIVQGHQAQEIDGQLVDAQTANLLVQVHDALSPENQAKFDSVPLQKLVELGWKRAGSTTAQTYYFLANEANHIVGGPYVDLEDANMALSGHQDENLHVQPQDDSDDSEGEFASYGTLGVEAARAGWVPTEKHAQQAVERGHTTKSGVVYDLRYEPAPDGGFHLFTTKPRTPGQGYAPLPGAGRTGAKTASEDDTPYGRDGDHCPWCGADWKHGDGQGNAHYEECPVNDDPELPFRDPPRLSALHTSAANTHCRVCGERLTRNDSGELQHAEYGYQRGRQRYHDPIPGPPHRASRIACKKCIAGHDPSGGDCAYCDGQGSLDLTLAMVKAADGWDQGLSVQSFQRTAIEYGEGAHYDQGYDFDKAVEVAKSHLPIEQQTSRNPVGFAIHELPGGAGYRVYPNRVQEPGGLLPPETPPGTPVAIVDPSGEVRRIAAFGDQRDHDNGDTIPCPNGHPAVYNYGQKAWYCPTCGWTGASKQSSLIAANMEAFQREADWAAAQQALKANNGKQVKISYNDDTGQRTITGTLSYDGHKLALDGKPLNPAYVIDVQASGTGDASEGLEPGRTPKFWDTVMHGNFPSGAFASKTALDVPDWMRQTQDMQELMQQTQPQTPPAPPAAPAAPTTMPTTPAAPDTTPRTTRPRGGKPQSVNQGFASLITAQDAFLDPPPTHEVYEQKVHDIANDISTANPDISPEAALAIAREAVSRYPETVSA